MGWKEDLEAKVKVAMDGKAAEWSASEILMKQANAGQYLSGVAGKPATSAQWNQPRPLPGVSYGSDLPDSPMYEGAYSKDTGCKACGTTGPHTSTFMKNIVVRVKENRFAGSPNSPVAVEYEKKDRSMIRRTCTNCGHTWDEAPIYLVPELVAARMLGEEVKESA